MDVLYTEGEGDLFIPIKDFCYMVLILLLCQGHNFPSVPLQVEGNLGAQTLRDKNRAMECIFFCIYLHIFRPDSHLDPDDVSPFFV